MVFMGQGAGRRRGEGRESRENKEQWDNVKGTGHPLEAPK